MKVRMKIAISGTRDGSPWPDSRLLCGARIEILVERLDADDAAVQTRFAQSRKGSREQVVVLDRPDTYMIRLGGHEGAAPGDFGIGQQAQRSVASGQARRHVKRRDPREGPDDPDARSGAAHVDNRPPMRSRMGPSTPRACFR